MYQVKAHHYILRVVSVTVVEHECCLLIPPLGVVMMLGGARNGSRAQSR